MGFAFGFRVPGSLKSVLFFFSVAVIITATLLPFGGMAAERIPPAWCLKCGTLWLTDAIANVALFVPFGTALAWLWYQRRWSFARVAAASFGFSLLIEVLQSLGLPPGRSAALADVFTNSTGCALGYALWYLLHTERTRTRAGATLLATVWGALALVVFVLTSMAVQPVESPPATGTLALTKSPFTHVPGHAWYEAPNDSAQVNDTTVRRGWSGPHILQANADVLPVRAAVWARGTDPNGGQIPLLFVHLVGDSSAWLQIAKHGDDAELTVLRNAWRWGMSLPSVTIAQVFRGRDPAESSTLELRATVTRSHLTIEQYDARGVRTAVSTLALTPLIGWTLIQPIFSVQSQLAWFARWSWLLTLLYPVGWWAMRARGVSFSLLMGAAVLGPLAVLPVSLGVAPLSWVDWVAVTVCFALGAIVASVLPRFTNSRVPREVTVN